MTPASLGSTDWMLCVGITVCFQSESLSGFIGIRTNQFGVATSSSCTKKTNDFRLLDCHMRQQLRKTVQ
jgi:hypothetical protein